MAEQTTPGEFKTSAFGFKKAQVLAYIDQLTAQNLAEQQQHTEKAQALQKDLDELKADNQLLLEKTKEVCDKLTHQQQLAGEAESRARAVSEQLQHMEQTASGYKSRLFTKEQETVVLRAENARLLAQLADQQAQLEQAQQQAQQIREQSEEQARQLGRQLENERRRLDEEAQQANRQLARQKEDAAQQLELEKARLAQAQRTQQQKARQSAQQMADTVLLLRSQLDQVDAQIAQAAARLQKATSAIYAALGETEQNLETLGAQAQSFPQPLAAQPAPKPPRRAAPPRPVRRRTVSDGLLELLDRALKN